MPRTLGILYLLSAINLALMIPGGFVETRSFPDYPILIIAAFNLLLTVLGFASLFFAYRSLVQHRNSGYAALIGASFVLVYLVDLAGLFPVSQAPMSLTLITLELVGVILGATLAVIGISADTKSQSLENSNVGLTRQRLWLLLVPGTLIVAFATYSAI